VTDHPARRLWITLETLHDVVYFAPEVRSAGVARGLRGFWMTYFAFRAAPFGAVDAEIVIATFANFEPGMVAKAIPDAWSRATPAACLEARRTVSAEVLRAAGVEESAAAAAAERLAPVIVRADPTGRPLFAVNTVVPPGPEPVGALWQMTTALREHRGDGHVAALVAAGISGLEAHVLQSANGRLPAAAILAVRGWGEDDWAAAVKRLQDRGLVDPEPLALTELGRACLTEIEAVTDNSSWAGAVAHLGEEGVDEVVEILAPAVDAVRRSGILPAINPAGLPSSPTD
jgi:hypothetical protein